MESRWEEMVANDDLDSENDSTKLREQPGYKR